LRIFKNIRFTKFANKSGITDKALCKAVMNAEQGLIDADLGGGVIKQRVARQGEGKSGGFRTMILFKKGDKSFFVHGFAKNKFDNISDNDLIILKKLASQMLSCTDAEIDKLVKENLLTEVIYEEKTVS